MFALSLYGLYKEAGEGIIFRRKRKVLWWNYHAEVFF